MEQSSKVSALTKQGMGIKSINQIKEKQWKAKSSPKHDRQEQMILTSVGVYHQLFLVEQQQAVVVFFLVVVKHDPVPGGPEAREGESLVEQLVPVEVEGGEAEVGIHVPPDVQGREGESGDDGGVAEGGGAGEEGEEGEGEEGAGEEAVGRGGAAGDVVEGVGGVGEG